MARAAHLASWFLTGCIAWTLLGWIASLDKQTVTVISIAIGFIACGYGLCWLLDDSICQILRLSELDYKAGLICFIACAIVGLAIAILIGGMAL